MDYSSRVEAVCKAYNKRERKYIDGEAMVLDVDDHKKLKRANRQELYEGLFKLCDDHDVSIRKVADILDLSGNLWDGFVAKNGLEDVFKKKKV